MVDQQNRRNLRSLWLCLGFILTVVGIGLASEFRPSLIRPIFSPILTTDINQTRLNTALPVPHGDLTISQSFVPRWNGLREIELILVRHGEAEEGENGQLFLELYDDSDSLIAEDILQTRRIQHNQTHLFRFPAQGASAGHRYRLHLATEALLEAGEQSGIGRLP